MPTLGINDKFPNLVGCTQFDGEFDLYEYQGGDWLVVLMHPGDFTPVCTTELGAAAGRQKDFKARGVKICGFSCNDASSHRLWIKDIEAATGNAVSFPLFCDPTRDFATTIGVLDQTLKDAEGLPLTVRACFIVDPSRTIKAAILYPASTGRSMDEILRCIDSLKLTSEHSVATPVDWHKGQDVIINFPLSDHQAREKFDSFHIVDLPSEQNGKGVWMPDKHYLRTTKDPSTT